MDKPGYTKGPWFLINDHCVGGPIEPGWEEAGCGVAHCGMRARTAEEATANARLIAAAPEMFEALRDLSIFYGDDTEAREILRSDFTGPEPLLMDDDALRESVWSNARAALSKALGEGQDSNG